MTLDAHACRRPPLPYPRFTLYAAADAPDLHHRCEAARELMEEKAGASYFAPGVGIGFSASAAAADLLAAARRRRERCAELADREGVAPCP